MSDETPPPKPALTTKTITSTAKKATTGDPVSQQMGGQRPVWWPEWAKQLPYFRLPQQRKDFTLLDRVKMRQVLEGADPKAIEAIEKDLDLLERELLPLFSKRDTEASLQQNRYRLYQLGFIVLAMVATIVGSIQALALGSAPRWVIVLASIETIVALGATYLATISGREEPMSRWLGARRRAESLRREFFRFLMDLPPYDVTDGYKRRMLLSERAALINQGTFPDERSATDPTPPVGG